MADEFEVLETGPQDTAGDQRSVVLQFESLGGAGHGCEFGIFQRHLGADPLGLLRWADLGHQALTAALATRFDGVGQPEYTTVFDPTPQHDEHGNPITDPASRRHAEWWSRDTRYWMAMRTFMLVSEVPYEKACDLILRRLQFLREKLISDLQAGEKIFVYKSIPRNLTPEELAALYSAVRSYGENTLLYLRYSDAAHPDGSVVRLAPGLLVGAVDHFSFSPDNENLGAPSETFLAICQEALRLWHDPAISESPSEIAHFYAGLADHFAGRGRAEEALAAIRQSLGVEPTNPHWQGRLAQVLLQVGQLADAESVIRSAIAEAPNIAALYDALARTLERQGRPIEEILPALRRLAELEADDPHVFRRLGRSLVRVGDHAGAEVAFRQELTLREDAVLHIELSDALGRQGHNDQALEQVGQALKLQPANANWHIRRAQLLLQSDRAAEAEAAARAAIELDGSISWFDDVLIQALDRQGRLTEGLREIEQTAASASDNAERQARSGNVLLKAKRYEEAAAALEKAIELQPRIAQWHDWLSLAYDGAKKLDRALAEAREASALAPNDARRLGRIGQLLLLQREGYSEAEQVLGQAIALHGDASGSPHMLSGFHHMLSIALERQNKWAGAVDEARRVMELSPGDANRTGHLAALLMQVGAVDEAIAILQRAVTLHPSNLDLHRLLGSALQRQGRADDAVEMARNLVASQPDDEASRRYLAQLLEHSGKPEEAERFLTRAEGKEPAAPSPQPGTPPREVRAEVAATAGEEPPEAGQQPAPRGAAMAAQPATGPAPVHRTSLPDAAFSTVSEGPSQHGIRDSLVPRFLRRQYRRFRSGRAAPTPAGAEENRTPSQYMANSNDASLGNSKAPAQQELLEQGRKNLNSQLPKSY